MTEEANPELERVEAIYDGIAPEWDGRQGLVERLLMGRAMRESLAGLLHGDVLEIGTGTGPTLALLADNARVTSFTGVDLSQGMLDQAQRKSGGLPFPVELRRMEAGRLDFPDATFDTVTTSLMLCTVPDPALALGEMARVCKPDGLIVVLEHVRARNPALAGLQKLLTPLQARMLGCHLDRPTDRLVRDLGFRVELDTTRFFGVFHLIVAKPPATSFRA
ncbi:MAG: class I SAM-dependent methyltransferase [Chloroflexia bacterium]|nr:class I SAM-dependent methyltransferase [Chloroflexia bacterium]